MAKVPLPPHPKPWRLRFWYYAMADFADDREMKLNQVHPSQSSEAGNQPDGVEIRMPGGAKGFKRLGR